MNYFHLKSIICRMGKSGLLPNKNYAHIQGETFSLYVQKSEIDKKKKKKNALFPNVHALFIYLLLYKIYKSIFFSII